MNVFNVELMPYTTVLEERQSDGLKVSDPEVVALWDLGPFWRRIPRFPA